MIEKIKSRLEEEIYNITIGIGEPVDVYEFCQQMLAFIRAMEKEYVSENEKTGTRKSNSLFGKCVENCDPSTMKEVPDNVDKMLEKEQEVDLEKEVIRYKVPFSDEREYLNETTLDAIARHFYELGLNAKEKSEIPTIKGWVARDEKDGRLDFFYKKPPIRGNKEWLPNGAGMISSIVFKDFFPDLKWEDEPIEVELTISRVIK